MDRLSVEARSALMSRIRSRDTKPELRLRKALWAAGLQYRKNVGDLPGKPDVVFRKARVCVFMDGCFWHGCPKCHRPPKSNGGFWRAKVEANKMRDRRQEEELAEAGWTVLRFWEHEVGGSLGRCVAEVESAVKRDG